MDLAAARDLKRHIRERFVRPPFALGLSLTNAPGRYRVAILLHAQHDRRLLRTDTMRAILRSAGKEVDVEVLGAVRRSSGGGGVRPEGAPLTIGASVGHYTGGDGSIGFFAEQHSTGRRGLVSCSHVIALVDEGVDGDGVISPSGVHGGRSPRNRVATLDGSYPRLAGPDRAPADCAFAFLADGIRYDPGSVDGGTLVITPAAVVERLEVTKRGCMTGTRTGVVVKIEVDNVPVQYGDVRAVFDDVIQIGSTSSARFAGQGDSGALVYTTQTFQPVGLLFAASDAGGPHNAGWAWAHPIARVTQALGVEMVVT